MATVNLTLAVPEERVDAVYAAAGGIPRAAAQAPGPAPASPSDAPWVNLACDALRANLAPFEQRLLRRLTYAHGQRVPLSELSADFGLPETATPAEDFPGLTAFCNAAPTERPFPIHVGTDAGNAWYWMSPVDASAFAFAFDLPPAERDPESGLDHDQARPAN